jgi:putative drug exporter of the RND superfamily
VLHALTRLALRRGRLVVLLVLLAVPVLALVGGGVADRLTTGGFVDPGSESARVARLLDEVFDAGPSNYVVLARTEAGTVESPENAAAGLELTGAIAAQPGVDEVVSFWALQGVLPDAVNPLRSTDGTAGLVAVRLGGDEDAQRETAGALEALVGRPDASWTARYDTRPGGEVEISRSTAEQAEHDLRVAELVATPLTLVALLLIFRGWRAAVLPLVVAVLAVLGTYVVLTVLTTVTDISTFALNLTSALGLGLSIDYSLLLVARYREELGAGREPSIALHRTMQTAGRTVLFSGATVAASMLALLVFPIAYLRSFAYAGVAVVVTACLATVVVAPALLAVMGTKIGVARAQTGHGGWRAQTARVVRRPWPWLIAVVGILVVLGIPFLGVDPGRIDDRVLPVDAPARQVADEIRRDFDVRDLNTVAVVAPEVAPDDAGLVLAVEQVLLDVPGVARVDSVLGSSTPAGRLPIQLPADRFTGDGATWFAVTIEAVPDTDEAEASIAELRTGLDRIDTPLLVGGATASTADAVDAVVAHLPLALAVVGVVTLVLLFMLTGSVVVPIKALVLNLLSLTATFGALVWIFQEGHLGGVFGVTATGRIDVFTPVLMFCIAFGLSMDYEVFLLARIKEEYDLTGDNDLAVIDGIGHTGRLVTAAAVLLSLVFVAISTSQVTIVKMFGVGLAIAVVTDAFAVRATVIPAVMALAGRANWWAPRFLRTLHLRWGMWENEPVLLPADAGPTVLLPELPMPVRPPPPSEHTVAIPAAAMRTASLVIPAPAPPAPPAPTDAWRADTTAHLDHLTPTK